MKDIRCFSVMSDVEDDTWQSNDINSVLEFAIGLGPSSNTPTQARNVENITTLSMMDLTERLVKFTSSTKEIMAGEDLLDQIASNSNRGTSGQASGVEVLASFSEERLHPLVNIARVLGQGNTETNRQWHQNERQDRGLLGNLNFPDEHHLPSKSSYISGHSSKMSSDFQLPSASHQLSSDAFSGNSTTSLLQSQSWDVSSNRPQTSTPSRATVGDISDHQYSSLSQGNVQALASFEDPETGISDTGNRPGAIAQGNNLQTLFSSPISDYNINISNPEAYNTPFLSLLDVVSDSSELIYNTLQNTSKGNSQVLQSSHSSQLPSNEAVSAVEGRSLFNDNSDQTNFNITDAFIDYATVEIGSTQSQEPTAVSTENQPESELFDFPTGYSGTVTICRSEDVLRSFQLTDIQSRSSSNDSRAGFDAGLTSSSGETFSSTKLAQTIRSGMNIKNNVDLDISSSIISNVSQNTLEADQPSPIVWDLDFSSITSEENDFQTEVVHNESNVFSELNTPMTVPLNALTLDQVFNDNVNPSKRPHSALEPPFHSPTSQRPFLGRKKVKASSSDSHVAAHSSSTSQKSSDSFASSGFLPSVRPTTLDLTYTSSGIQPNAKSLVSRHLMSPPSIRSEISSASASASPVSETSPRAQAFSDIGNPQLISLDSSTGLATTRPVGSVTLLSNASPITINEESRSANVNPTGFSYQFSKRQAKPSLAKHNEYSYSPTTSSQTLQSLYSSSLDQFIQPSPSDLSPDTCMISGDPQKIIALDYDGSSSVLESTGPSRKVSLSRTLSDNSDVSFTESETSSSFSVASTAYTDAEGPVEPVIGHKIKETLRSKLKAKGKAVLLTDHVSKSGNGDSQRIVSNIRKAMKMQGEITSPLDTSIGKVSLTTNITEEVSTSLESHIKMPEEDETDDREESIIKEMSKPSTSKKKKGDCDCDEEEEDEETKLAKRNKNRLAAQRCRHKKRNKIEVLTKQVQKLEDKQDRIKTEVTRLEDEREQLEEMLRLHTMVCSLKDKGRHSTDKKK